MSRRIKMQKTENTEPLTKKQKIKKLLSYGLATILALGLIAVVMQLLFIFEMKKSGYESPTDAASGFLTHINNVDESGIKNSMYFTAVGKDKAVKNYYEVAKSHENTLNMHIDSATYAESEWDIDEAKRTVGVQDLQDAECVSVTMDVNKTLYENTFDTVTCYDVHVYKVKDKWFVYDANETATIITNCNGQSHSDITFGTASLGTMCANNAWTQIELSANEKSKFIDVIRCGNGYDEITLGKLNASDIEDIRSQYKSIFKDNGFKNITLLDSEISGMPAKSIIAYDSENETYVYMWLFKPPITDGNIMMLSATTKNPFSTYLYIKSYKY